MQNFCSQCGSKLVDRSTICSECQTPIPLVNEFLNKHKVEEVKNKIFGFSQKLQFGSKKLSETITKYAQSATDSLQKKSPEDLVKKAEELKIEFENGEVQMGAISNLSSIFQSNEAKKICFNYINTYFNYNNSIDFKITDATYKDNLFCEYICSLDAHYTYQSGCEDSDALNQANLEYERDYRQYQMAMNQIETAYANARVEFEKAIQQNRTPPDRPHLIEPDKPRKPKQDDYMVWGDYVDGHVEKECERNVLPVGDRKFYEASPYCQTDNIDKFINEQKIIPVQINTTPSVDFEIQKTSKKLIDLELDIAITDGIGDYYNRNKQATSKSTKVKYRFFCIPAWTITAEYKNKSYLFYLDELNGLIDGDEIKENVVFAFFNNLMSDKSKPVKSDVLDVNLNDPALEEKYKFLKTERLQLISSLFNDHPYSDPGFSSN